MTLELDMKYNHLSDHRPFEPCIEVYILFYLRPINERQKTQPWGVWSLPLLLISTQRVITITLSCYQWRIWKHSVYDTFTILVCKNADSFLQHLKNQKHSIHFIDVTNSNNTLTIHGTASSTRAHGLQDSLWVSKVYISGTGSMHVRLNEYYGRSRNHMLRQRPLQFQKTPGNHLLWTEVEYIDCDPIIIHAG